MVNVNIFHVFGEDVVGEDLIVRGDSFSDLFNNTEKFYQFCRDNKLRIDRKRTHMNYPLTRNLEREKRVYNPLTNDLDWPVHLRAEQQRVMARLDAKALQDENVAELTRLQQERQEVDRERLKKEQAELKAERLRVHEEQRKADLERLAENMINITIGNVDRLVSDLNTAMINLKTKSAGDSQYIFALHSSYHSFR